MEVAAIDGDGCGVCDLVQHRHRYCAGVDAAPPLGRWHALDAMAADFMTKAGDRGELYGRCAIDRATVVQSAEVVEKTGICDGEIADEQASVAAAFAGADFDDHDGFLKDMRKGWLVEEPPGQLSRKVSLVVMRAPLPDLPRSV
jgi:hypothetical protein